MAPFLFIDMKLRLLFFLFIGLVYSQRVVGYYPWWVQDQFEPEELDLVTFTHINHAFAWPNDQGGIEATSGTFDTSIADHIHNNNRKFLLSLGGWGTADGFVAATSTYELRSVFISNILDKFIT